MSRKTNLCVNCNQWKDEHSNKGLKCPTNKAGVWALTTFSYGYAGKCRRINFNDMLCDCKECEDMPRPAPSCSACQKLEFNGIKGPCADCANAKMKESKKPARQCRKCEKPLKDSRYFYCRHCIQFLPADNGDLIYTEYVIERKRAS